MIFHILVSWNWQWTTIQIIMHNIPYTNFEKTHHWNSNMKNNMHILYFITMDPPHKMI
jgi:hypothetical protein